MECAYVPGYSFVNLLYESRNRPQFIVRVVMSGDDQGGDFYPDVQLVVQGDGIKHRLQFSAAHRAVECIGKTFQINVRRVKIGADCCQRLGIGIAVGDKHVGDPGLPRKTCGVVRVFKIDGGLGIGVGYAPAAELIGQRDNG